ncbi:MAG: DUF2252 domain-containing protein [Actinomycetota bacterium]|nr:DUF2252 domain-containing protein [Actinomycetota bacterium]
MTWSGKAPHRSVDQRKAYGKSLRESTPRSSHAEWSPSPDRPDPVDLIESQNDGRLQWLVPVRRGRMVENAFTFYRGAALIMASDLSTTPSTGLTTQICGDAHLSNFGAYGSAERELVFDVNDFDESLVGPWEWDLKRLATSFTIAGRHLGFDDSDIARITASSVEQYRTAMEQFSEGSILDTWYSHLSIDDVTSFYRDEGKKKKAKKAAHVARKARSKNSLQALSKLAERVDGTYRIKSDPPVLVPLRDATHDATPDELEETARRSFDRYRESLRPDRRILLDKFRPIDIALKVVGVGSVGTRCLIVLLEGRDEQDPLFLQIKEAGPSVLEGFLPADPHENHGERVVQGQRLMQASSDIFLGWSPSYHEHDYYWRQLRDWKGSFDVDDADERDLRRYAKLCGWTLARSHARSGDPAAIDGYLGSNDTFARAITEFAGLYADQNESDYRALADAIDRGDLQADFEN